MSDEVHSVESIVALVDSMVTSSGGKLKLDDFDPVSGRIRATYEVSDKRDCEMCYFDPAFVEEFLCEALSTHDIEYTDVVVTTIKV